MLHSFKTKQKPFWQIFNAAIDAATSALQSNFTTSLTNATASILMKTDVENIVVQKWQDELDSHIQSHYDLQNEVSIKFSTFDQTIQMTVQEAINTHPNILHLISSTHSTLLLILYLLVCWVFINQHQRSLVSPNYKSS